MADLDYMRPRTMHKGCEWNPVEGRPARATDMHTRMVPAVTVVGAEPGWRLCHACAKLPYFAHPPPAARSETCVFGYVADGKGGHQRCARERDHTGPCAAPEAGKVKCRYCDAFKWPGSDCPECGKGDY